MSIPIVNNRAFGYQTLFGAPKPVASMRTTLGDPMGPAIAQAELDFNQARSYYSGIENMYNDLVELLGENVVKNALDQAAAFYNEASEAMRARKPRFL